METVSVVDDPARHRYELRVDGEPAGFAAYREAGGVVTVTHSEVDPRWRGRGLGDELARRTLAALRERGVRVRPSCPFFARYVRTHPGYDDLVVDGAPR